MQGCIEQVALCTDCVALELRHLRQLTLSRGHGLVLARLLQAVAPIGRVHAAPPPGKPGALFWLGQPDHRSLPQEVHYVPSGRSSHPPGHAGLWGRVRPGTERALERSPLGWPGLLEGRLDRGALAGDQELLAARQQLAELAILEGEQRPRARPQEADGSDAGDEGEGET